MIRLKQFFQSQRLSASRWLLLLFYSTLVLASCEDGRPTTDEHSAVSDQQSEPPSRFADSPQGEMVDTVVYHPHLDTAMVYVGITDGGNNDSPDVNRFLASVGLRPGNPWCAAFVSYCLDKAAVSGQQSANSIHPDVRSGLATDFITSRSIKATNVLMGINQVPGGSVVIWRKGNGIFGHAGLVECWDKASGVTVEGNTSRPATDDGRPTTEQERDGEGVYVKERTIEPGNYFRIVQFTPVEYEMADDGRAVTVGC